MTAAPPLPRDQFPVTDRFHYLDHATVAAPPAVVAQAVGRDAAAATMLGSAGEGARLARAESVRAGCATVLGGSVEDVAFVGGTSQGMGMIASGLTWSEGDVVITVDRDHSLTLGPWRALAPLGVEVRSVEVDEPAWSAPPERIADALAAAGGRARVVVVSWVNAARGFRHDLAPLAEVAHAHDALLVVDMIQGLGVIPAAVDRWGVDAAVAGAQKWLLGTNGLGILWTTPELRSQLRLTHPAWHLLVADGPTWVLDPAVDPSARRFEGGAANLTGLAALGAGVDLLVGAGIDEVWAHADSLADSLVDGLLELGVEVVSDRSAAGRSAIVSARLATRDADDVVDGLLVRGVVAASRLGCVRFSPHGWNDLDDVRAALDALRAVARIT